MSAMKYKYGPPLAAAVAGGVYLALLYVNPFDGTISLSELVLQLSGSRGSFALGFFYPELVLFAMKLFPAFVFEAYAGILLYRHFCTAATYVFSRYPHRGRWYAGEACRLGVTAGVFQALLLAAVIVITASRYKLQADAAGLMLAAYHFLIHSLWVYIMALTVNLAAVYLGSSTAYGLVIGGQMICIILLNVTDVLVRRFQAVLSYGKILAWNPIARLVLGWHGSEEGLLQQDLSTSLLVFLLLGAAITAVSAVMIKKHDFLAADAEAD